MPDHETSPAEISPQSSEPAIQELLTLSQARIIPLSGGESITGYARNGEYFFASAAQGQLTLSTHDQYALLNPGQVMVLAAPGSYTLQGVSDSLAMTVLLEGELPGKLLDEVLQEGALLLSGGGTVVRKVVLALAVLEEEAPPVSGPAASVAAYHLLLHLRGQAGQKEGAEKRVSLLVESAIGIIQEDFPYLEGLDELAERLEVSKAHLIRQFTKAVGISPGKYITRVKVDYAKLLLQGEEPSISYVAEASGFANSNYFAKVFRRETGMTPTEYIESSPRQTAEQREATKRDQKTIW